jgi:hypothetical protein
MREGAGRVLIYIACIAWRGFPTFRDFRKVGTTDRSRPTGFGSCLVTYPGLMSLRQAQGGLVAKLFHPVGASVLTMISTP